MGLSKPLDDSTVTGPISKLPGVVSVEKMDSRNLRIRFSGEMDAQERLLADLVSLRIGVISFRASGSALEDTYLNLIKDTL